MKPGGVFLVNETSVELTAACMGEVKSDAVGQRWWKSDVFTNPASSTDIQGSAILRGKRIKNKEQRKNKMRFFFSSHLDWAGGGKRQTSYCFQGSYNVNAVTLGCHASYSVLFWVGLIIWMSENLIAASHSILMRVRGEGGREIKWPKVKLNEGVFCHSLKLTAFRLRLP